MGRAARRSRSPPRPGLQTRPEASARSLSAEDFHGGRVRDVIAHPGRVVDVAPDLVPVLPADLAVRHWNACSRRTLTVVPGGNGQFRKPSPVMVHSKMLSSNTHSSVANRYRLVILWMCIEPKIFRYSCLTSSRSRSTRPRAGTSQNDVVGVDRDGLLDTLRVLVVEVLVHRGEVAGDDLFARAFGLRCHECSLSRRGPGLRLAGICDNNKVGGGCCPRPNCTGSSRPWSSVPGTGR